LAFSLSLQDSATANSLVKTCTLGSANTWLLIQLPNLPVWSGTYSAAPGQVGYFLQIALAVGTTFSAAASSAWQAANILGVTGNSNFLATAGATFDLAFLQHEPGAQCTTPIDCSFQQNYDDCLRYFQKTYDYGIVPATVTSNGVIALVAPGPATVAHGSLRFFKPMAKTPVMTMYNWATGAANSVRDAANTDHGSVAASNLVSTGFSGISFTTATAAANGVYVHYTADTGW
jgi:hypothetical protein